MATSILRNVESTTFHKTLKLLCRSKIARSSSNVSSSSNIQNSQLPDVIIPRTPLFEYIFSKCEKYERLTAIECGITGRKYTFGQLFTKSKNFSHALKKLALKKGDVVALLVPNVPEFPIAALGVLHSGLVATTLNPNYTPEEIFRQLKDSSAKVLITVTDLWDTAIASNKTLKLPIIAIKTNQTQSLPAGAIDFREFTENAINHPDPEPAGTDDVAFLPYSSGTTGLPKGVQLTNGNIVANLCQHTSPYLPLFEKPTNTHQDIVPVILPMFHIYGFTANTLLSLTHGVKLVTLPKFTPTDYVSVLRKHKPDILFLVPPIVLFLAGHSMVEPKDLESVRTTFCGAAPLGALDEQRFVEKVGKQVHMLQGYGLTESSPGVATYSIPLKLQYNVSGTIGRPIHNTLVKVVPIDDPNGAPLGPNTTGELLVKGPQVMKGYLNRPEETNSTLVNGWLRTGDMVHYNKDGLFFITDRLKELIKVKGFQVAPAELEEVIRSFPGVEDAAVIGVPDSRQGEAPRAYVVPKKNYRMNSADLEEYVKGKVAHYKQLKGGVVVVDSIPKNASGKILRRSLKMEYEKSEQK